MLSIVYDTKNMALENVHVGEVVSRNSLAIGVISIQADGHELEFIAKNFSNIPIPKTNSVVIWYGEMARFILSNIVMSPSWAKKKPTV